MVLGDDYFFIEGSELGGEFLWVLAGNNLVILAVDEQSWHFALMYVI